MATLNARKGLRDGSSAAADTSVSLRDLHPSHANTANFSVSNQLRNSRPHVQLTNQHTQKRDHNSAGIAIRIDTHKESRHDAELEVRGPSFLTLDV